jgi:DNA modification methylase
MSANAYRDLSIQRVPTADLKPNPRNPRKHSDRQISQIAHSIGTFGFNVPILIDRDNYILAGHGRWRAGQKLGLHDVPAIRLDLAEAEARAFMIADNRLAELATWDDRVLAGQLSELSELSLDFSLEATGFTMGEIDLRIEGLSDETTASDDEADRLPPTANQPAVSHRGDLWLLAEHRVHCGNALDEQAYQTLMRGERAPLVFTDPPYNTKIFGHASGLGGIRHREFAMASGEMSEAEFTSFLTVVCTLLVRNSTDGSIHFVCMDWRHVGELLAAGRVSHTELKNICIWVKHNAGMGSLYRSQHELIFVLKAGRGAHRNNIQLGQNGRHRSNVWCYPAINNFGRATDEGHLLSLHPTVKPVRLVADAILDCSVRGDVVLDSFLGSGTTVIAAERTGRRCYGLEIDPLYVDTVVRRWQTYTGDQAVHASTGKRFDEIAAERLSRRD